MPLPLIAIVGAPNVGKSTLFNRLVGQRRAIVTDEPGVTRDRIYGEARRVARPFRVVDTGGMTPNTAAPLASEIEEQAATALGEAAGIIFVVDARAGISSLEIDLATMLRRRSTPLILVANKIDSPKRATEAHELSTLGLGDALPISSEHGLGVDVLLDRIEEILSGLPAVDDTEEEAERPVRVAIVGRPNVGKSSLMNRLVGEDRVVVSDVPGTTLDAVDTLLELGDRRYLLIDTAGFRRRGKVRRAAERFSVERARSNIERCDVAVLVIDGSTEFAAQDAHIAGYVHDAHRPLVVAINKWDLVEEREAAAKKWEEQIRFRLRFAKQAPMQLVSALTGQRVTTLLERVDELFACSGRWVPTVDLNRWVELVRGPTGLSPATGRGLRVFYATQTGVHPPRFLLFCNDPERVHFSLKRHLENRLREHFDFGAAPIRLEFRGRREKRSP